MTDYTMHHYDKDLLRQSATLFVNFTVNPTADLAEVRKMIENYCNETPSTGLKLSDWCFLDCQYFTSQLKRKKNCKLIR